MQWFWVLRFKKTGLMIVSPPMKTRYDAICFRNMQCKALEADGADLSYKSVSYNYVYNSVDATELLTNQMQGEL